jgi:PEP-CTERM motif
MAAWQEESAVPNPRFRVQGGLAFLFVSLFILSLAQNVRAITINFSNLAETDVDFSSSQFTFSNVSISDPYQFSVTSVDGGVEDSVGLDGYVSPGGPFTIGAVTINGGTQTAPVSGTGILHITDADDVDLTGSLTWQNITTLGVGGILNLTGLVNLTSITYPSNLSSDPSIDLETLAAGGSASDVVTFQFVPAMTLSQLVSTGGSTSYSGSIENSESVVPEPASIALVGLGAVSLLARRRRS